MKRALLLLFALLPLQWVVVPGTGQRVHLLAMVGFTAVVLFRYRASAFRPVVAVAAPLIVADAVLIAIWLSTALYHGHSLRDPLQEIVLPVVMVSVGAVILHGARVGSSRVFEWTRWSALVATTSVLVGLSLSMRLNGINPVSIFAQTIAQADPSILQRELFRSAFSGLGITADSSRANFRHEIFGAVLTATYLSLASTALRPITSAPARAIYRLSLGISVALILVSLSRSVILALAVWPLLALWRVLLSGRFTSRQLGLAALAAVSGAALWVSGVASLLVLRFTSDTASYQERDRLLGDALRNIRSHLLIGGVDTTNASSHNIILDSWLRSGVFGAAAAVTICVLLVGLWVVLALRLHREPDWMFPVVCALALPIVRLFTAGGGSLPPPYWVTLGIVAGFLCVRAELTTSHGDGSHQAVGRRASPSSLRAFAPHVWSERRALGRRAARGQGVGAMAGHAGAAGPTRRQLLALAAGGALSATGVTACAPQARSTTTRVRPLSAMDVRAGTGVAAHPSFIETDYAHVDAWMERLASTGVRTFRGLYDPSSVGCQEAVAACRKYGVSWLMLVVPEGAEAPTLQTVDETTAVVLNIAEVCPDICYGLEGLNEPNHDRSSRGSVSPDWASAYAAPHQQAIWEAVQRSPDLRQAVVIGPSLHDQSAMSSYVDANPEGGPRHFDQLAATGISAWQHRVGMHRYPGGRVPLADLDERLSLIRSAYGDDTLVHCTETGYHNALFQPTSPDGGYDAGAQSIGHKPTSMEAAATYIGRAVLQLAKLNIPCVWFELLDDPDAGEKDVAQANFGLWLTDSNDPASWRAKPAATSVTMLMDELEEPDGPGYEPSTITLRLAAEPDARVECILTATRSGSVTAHLFRDLPVWDPVTRTALAVSGTPVTITDGKGSRTFQVDGNVRSVLLR